MDGGFGDKLAGLRRDLAESRASGVTGPRIDNAAAVADGARDDAGDSGVGSAHNGAVTVVAAAGRLRSIVFDPRLMRLSNVELGRELSDASSRALETCRSSISAADIAGLATTDLGLLQEQLRAARAEADRTIGMISAGLAEAITRVGRRTGMSGDPSLSGLQLLLEENDAVLRATQEQLAATDQDQAVGRGADSDGLISAEVDSGGRRARIDLHSRAMRWSSQDIADGAVVAVNAALDDLASGPAPDRTAAATAAGMDDLTHTIAGLQDHGVSRMQTDILRRS